MIKLPIRDLSNPLEGTFDLSRCGDTGKYLSISMGYRKGKRPENANKVEIWFAPRFLIERELQTTAKLFEPIYDDWSEHAEVGIFWTTGWGDDLTWYDYLITQNLDELTTENLYKKWSEARSTMDDLHGVCMRACRAHSQRTKFFMFIL